MAEETNPIADMLAVDDEAARKREPEADLNLDPPEDKKELERDETGKFKGKEEKVETKADDKAKVEPKLEERPKETVPLATFLEKTNKLKADLEAKDITLNEFKTRLAALEAKLPKAEAPAEPDFVEDPKGYVDHKLKSALEGIAEANKKAETAGSEAKATAQQATEQVQLQQFFGELQNRERAFVAQTPDYHDALAHIRGIRAAQMREFNPEVTEQQIVAAIRHEETQIAVTLHSQGRDPIQVAYNLAKHFGYQPKAKEEPKVETKLPDPTNKRLPPDQTLGSGAGAQDEPYKEGETDPVDLAIASLFRKRA